MTDFPTVRVAAVQATPVILDAEATIAKALGLIDAAAADGAQLVVLPETFVSLYPSNAWAHQAAGFGGSDELWERCGRAPWRRRAGGRPLRRGLPRARAPPRDRRERARGGAARDALQRAAPDRPRGPDREAPQADADPPRAPLPRHRRGRRPGGGEHANRAHRRPDLLGEPDAACALGGLPRRPADLGGAPRRRLDGWQASMRHIAIESGASWCRRPVHPRSAFRATFRSSYRTARCSGTAGP